MRVVCVEFAVLLMLVLMLEAVIGVVAYLYEATVRSPVCIATTTSANCGYTGRYDCVPM